MPLLLNKQINHQLRSTGLSAPLTVTWEITNLCNLSCTHCLSASGPNARTDSELSLEEAKGVVDQLAEEKVFQIHFGGGEPLVFPGFMDLLRHAQTRGFCCLCISTNGTLLTQEKITQLDALGGVYLQISLDGATEATCDAIRGKGTFTRALSALDRLKKSNMVRTLNFVFNRSNAHELDDILALAQEKEATLRVTRLKPSGRGADTYEQLAPTHKQQEKLHQWLQNHPDVLTGDTFFHLNALGGKPLPGFSFCGAARMTCLITPDGGVYPCAFTQSEAFLGGSLKTQNFGEIWRHSPLFNQSFRGGVAGACESCEAFQSCGGGCPAVKHAVKGRLDVPDPECVLAPKPETPFCEV